MSRKAEGGMLTINAPPLDTESYKQLKQEGLDCFLLWAETFNPVQYAKLHSGKTPKTEQIYRLQSYERAAEAGIEFLAGAFLKGLYNWRLEEIMLCSMDRHLKAELKHGFSIIGTPRYKGVCKKRACKGKCLSLIEPYQMQDDEYILNIALDMLIYSGAIWLQTREPWELNEKIIDLFGGGFIFTMDCSTAPGGYAAKPKGKEQFPVHFYSPELITPKLEEKGIEVKYSWSKEDLKKLQRE